MRQLLLLAAFGVACSNYAQAQKTTWLKAYAGSNFDRFFEFTDDTYNSRFRIVDRYGSRLMPTLGLETRFDNGRYQEISLGVDINPYEERFRSDTGLINFVKVGEVREEIIQLMFERGRPICIEDRPTMHATLGYFIRADWNRMTAKPSESSGFAPQWEQYAGVQLGFVPRIQYDINSWLRLDISAPMGILQVGYRNGFVDDVSLNDDLRYYGAADLTMQPSVHMRMGLAFKIGTKKETAPSN
jgi:hypothetical protein